jgi:acyl dehydratase
MTIPDPEPFGAPSYEDLIGRRTPPYHREWTADDAILYALSVGAGAEDPTTELQYTTEGTPGAAQTVLPAFASVIGKPHPDVYGLLGDADRGTILQSGYEVEWLTDMPLRASGRITATTTLTELISHRRGSLVTFESRASYDEDSDALFLTRSKVLVRDLFVDGTPARPASRSASADSEAETEGVADLTVAVPTFPHQALLHRLLGDRNPLHSDPVVAARAGFPRPILHGLCTFGIAARILTLALAPNRPVQLRRMAARFTAPVLPGDRLVVNVWKTSPDTWIWSVTGPGDRFVIDHGELCLRPA